MEFEEDILKKMEINVQKERTIKKEMKVSEIVERKSLNSLAKTYYMKGDKNKEKFDM